MTPLAFAALRHIWSIIRGPSSNPYMRSGRRWEAQDVRRAIGLNLRPSEYAYVLQKLSRPLPVAVTANIGLAEFIEPLDLEPGREFLREHYHAEAASLSPFVMREWSPF